MRSKTLSAPLIDVIESVSTLAILIGYQKNSTCRQHNICQLLEEQTTNQKPRTANQKPRTANIERI
jgi:hypothetical protein